MLHTLLGTVAALLHHPLLCLAALIGSNTGSCCIRCGQCMRAAGMLMHQYSYAYQSISMRVRMPATELQQRLTACSYSGHTHTQRAVLCCSSVAAGVPRKRCSRPALAALTAGLLMLCCSSVAAGVPRKRCSRQALAALTAGLLMLCCSSVAADGVLCCSSDCGPTHALWQLCCS
jgi:hypothetical protein